MREQSNLQRRLVFMLGQLIDFAYKNGYSLTLACARCAKPGHHMKNSLHYEGLAIDLNLFKRAADNSWKYCSSSLDHKPLGEFWEMLGGSWGGRFGESSPGAGDGRDGNHYSIAYQGRR